MLQTYIPDGSGTWIRVRDGSPNLRLIYDQHYSAYRYRDGRTPAKIIGPGEYIALLTPQADALFCWRRFIDASGQQGVNCSVFRNTGPQRSSDLIRSAMEIAWERWPVERLYTYVNPRRVRSTNPGYCFLCAGWRKCGKTGKGLIVLEAFPHG